MNTISLACPSARPPATSVRQAATAADWAAAAELLRRYLDWIERAGHISVDAAQPDFAREVADLERSYGLANTALFVAVEEGEVCGTVAARLDHDGAVEIKRMYVDPQRRGRGHAARLLQTALDWSVGAGAPSAWLETIPGVMDPAIDLYRRLGFRPLDRPPTVDLDSAIVMGRPLDADVDR